MFFKLRPEVITDQNLHNNILVSSMLESPINSLYQAVRQVFAPMLLKVRKLKELYGHFFFKLCIRISVFINKDKYFICC